MPIGVETDPKIKGQPIYDAKDFKNQREMIYFLKEKKSGTIKNALFNPNLGHIDLMWGNKDFGLNHIILKREKDFKTGKAKKDAGYVLKI